MLCALSNDVFWGGKGQSSSETAGPLAQVGCHGWFLPAGLQGSELAAGLYLRAKQSSQLEPCPSLLQTIIEPECKKASEVRAALYLPKSFFNSRDLGPLLKEVHIF